MLNTTMVTTSLSERYISSQFEKIKSTEPGEISRSGDVTSAHTNLVFLKRPLMTSFCGVPMVFREDSSIYKVRIFYKIGSCELELNSPHGSHFQ